MQFLFTIIRMVGTSSTNILFNQRLYEGRVALFQEFCQTAQFTIKIVHYIRPLIICFVYGCEITFIDFIINFGRQSQIEFR